MKNNWIDAILHNFQLKKSHYLSKCTAVREIDSLRGFVKNIDKIFNSETK